MNKPWFWVHLVPRNAMGKSPPTASRYPVLGFHKESDGEFKNEVIHSTWMGDVLLLIDDGESMHAIKQQQTLRCQEPNRTCPVCATGRSEDASGYHLSAAAAAGPDTL